MPFKAVIALEEIGVASPPLGSRGVPALAPVANRPILFHALDALRHAGVTDVVTVSGNAGGREVAAAIGDGSAFGVRAEHLRSRTSSSLAHAVLEAEGFVGDDPFVLHSGDGLLGAQVPTADELLTDHGPGALLLVHRDGALTATAPETRRMLRLANLAVNGTHLEVTSVSAFGGGAIAEGRRALERPGAGMYNLLDQLARGGSRLHVRMVRSWRRYRGAAEDLLELNRMVLDDLDPDVAAATLQANQIQGRVAIHPSATVEGSIIRGPVIVGEGAIVRDAYLGPGTAVGAHARIEGAEVEHSMVLEGARIENLGGRLEASIVGRDSRIYRDFTLPRAMRFVVGDGVNVALQ